MKLTKIPSVFHICTWRHQNHLSHCRRLAHQPQGRSIETPNLQLCHQNIKPTPSPTQPQISKSFSPAQQRGQPSSWACAPVKGLAFQKSACSLSVPAKGLRAITAQRGNHFQDTDAPNQKRKKNPTPESVSAQSY